MSEQVAKDQSASVEGAVRSDSAGTRSSWPMVVVVVVLLLLLMLPILYVLSVGPIVWLSSRELIHLGPWTEWFYTPLLYAVNNNGFLGNCFEWYVSFFEANRPLPPVPLTPPTPAGSPSGTYPTS